LEVNNLNFQEFKTVIESLKKVSNRTHGIYQFGIDLLDYDEDYHKVITVLMKSIFEEEGYDWISWYLYERDGFDGKVLSATDSDGNEICHNIESLWDTVKPYRKQ
jgi:hypothetical protein